MSPNGFGWRDNPTNIKRQTPRKRINGFKLAAWCVVALLALLFIVMELNAAHGETHLEPVAPVELNERAFVAVVMRGACCVIVGGGGVFTGTVVP